jgi:hypothetical protein
MLYFSRSSKREDKMYKIIDLQGMGTHEEERFKTKREIAEHLTNYHNIDFIGTDDKDNELSIEEYFKFWKINTVEKQLEYLLQYGDWSISRVRR